MSIVRVRVSLVVSALLASITGTAHGQATPAPQSDSAPPDGAAPLDPTAPPALPAPAAAPGPDPAMVRAAAKARAAGAVIQVTNPDAVRGCRDLGEEDVDTAKPGVRGRFVIRASLMETARTRGASHVQYSGYVLLADSNAQREHGHFYDCTAPAVSADTHKAAPEPSYAYSVQLELVPVGTLRFEGLDHPLMEADTVAAYGVSGNFEYLMTPGVALGVNPGVVLGLKRDGATASATELDVRARARIGELPGDGLGAHLYGSIGASWILMPGDAPTSVGAVIGFGAGVSHPVTRSMFITVEAGYQLGFQSATMGFLHFEGSTRLFHVGLGISSYL